MIEFISEFGISGRTGDLILIGRRPTATSPELSRIACDAGICARLQDGTVYYCGAASAHLKNGIEIQVPDSGFLDLEMSEIKNQQCFVELNGPAK